MDRWMESLRVAFSKHVHNKIFSSLLSALHLFGSVFCVSCAGFLGRQAAFSRYRSHLEHTQVFPSFFLVWCWSHAFWHPVWWCQLLNFFLSKSLACIVEKWRNKVKIATFFSNKNIKFVQNDETFYWCIADINESGTDEKYRCSWTISVSKSHKFYGIFLSFQSESLKTGGALAMVPFCFVDIAIEFFDDVDLFIFRMNCVCPSIRLLSIWSKCKSLIRWVFLLCLASLCLKTAHKMKTKQQCNGLCAVVVYVRAATFKCNDCEAMARG